MNKQILTIAVVGLLTIGCNKEKIFGTDNTYQDGFETVNSTDDLFPEDKTGWNGTQMTKNSNAFALDTFAYSGSQSLRFFAEKTVNRASKASIFRNKMAIYEGITIQLSAWYYLQGNEDQHYLFIMDLEESTPIGAGPGIRVGLNHEHLLFIERKKYIEHDIYQREEMAIEFPRNQWVNVKLEVELSQKKKGGIKLFQNDTLLIDAKKVKTLPTDYLYIIQGSAGLYTNIEFGITANSITSETTLFLDGVSVGPLHK